MSSLSLAREISQLNHWGPGAGGLSLEEENSLELISVFTMTSPILKYLKTVPVTLSMGKPGIFRIFYG
jgi:hypothetical protein